MVVGPRRPVGGDHLLGLHIPVQPADALLEGGQAEDVPVGEPPGAQLLQEAPLVLPGEGEQLVQGHRVHTGLGDVISGPHLVLVHPLFYQKWLDVHKTAPSQNLAYGPFAGADIIRPFLGISPPSCGRLIAAPTWSISRRGGRPHPPAGRWGHRPLQEFRPLPAQAFSLFVGAARRPLWGPSLL